LLLAGKPAIDAAVAGAQAVEDDGTTRSVGFGGIGNRIGTVSLDSCVMDGRTLDCGSVAGVENIRHVAALAKRVYEKTPHVMLVGEWARIFAIQNGFPLDTLNTPGSVADWEKNRPKPDELHVLGHDTVTVLAQDMKGHLGGACTTSGLAYKVPGRVGDSPIIGCGLYVDDTAGAAGGTGVGEEIIRVVGAMFIVEQMRAGKTPQEATEAAIQRVIANAGRRGVHVASVCFLALDPKGNVGAACTKGSNFTYAVARGAKIELLKSKELS
jgi:isoaspartyl peptidase/L-asparaginase-like protein (Ntn-hydrolase superfamily)